MTIRERGTLPGCAATVVVILAAASLSIHDLYGAQAVAIDRGSRDYTLPDQMRWTDAEDGKTSNLYGDPSKPGLYAYILKLGPNVWSKPHFHDNDRFVTVLEGTLWVGTGKFDTQRTVPLKPGSFVRDVAGGIHFEGTKDDGATLYFVGIGASPSRPSEPATATTSGAGADVIDQAIRQIQRIEDMPKESFVLYGDSSKPGLYLQYQRRAPNNWSRPHYHPIDRVVMVMGGTMRIGADSSGDKTRTVAVPKGGFIRDIAQGVHYDGSGDDPMWIQIAGVGPTATTNVDPPK
jgi:quercetin dioxygenase-like cupin family protein